jgi:hypothetical protein
MNIFQLWGLLRRPQKSLATTTPASLERSLKKIRTPAGVGGLRGTWGGGGIRDESKGEKRGKRDVIAWKRMFYKK